MKIGELAKKYKISKDTIRYYVEKGLLLPNKSGAQMNFTQREREDLELILKYKDLQFQLKEIKELLSLRRMSNLIEPDTIQACKKIMLQKKEENQDKIEQLQKANKSIDEEVTELMLSKGMNKKSMGVPLMALHYLACPHCQHKLTVCNADLFEDSILEGKLSCACGYQAEIHNGIIETKNIYTGNYDSPDLKRGLYRNVGEEFLTGFQKCSDMVYKEVKALDLKNKVVMETNINGYFFLYNHFKELEHDCLYIITDKYAEILSMYKNLIEQLNLPLNIMFIADASNQFPILSNSVDVLIDFYGSNEHFLYYKENFIKVYKKFLKDSGVIKGAMMGFYRNSPSLKNVPVKYPESAKNALNIDEVLAEYQREHMKIYKELVADIKKTYDRYSFACHEEGDSLLIYYYEAIRGV